MKNLLQKIPRQFIVPLFILAGTFVGLGIYSIYMSRAFSYLSDKPDTCINCHIMTPYYASWAHSSHGHGVTTCNECHVPHENIVRKYGFKAMDGLYHAAVFTVNAEPLAIRARAGSSAVIMKNCIRCHTEINQEMVALGFKDWKDVEKGNAKACWDCHRNIPHGTVSSIVSAPSAQVPLPKSPAPQWLKKQIKK
ncbi:MAG: cytochrome c nitrite reductase small subunit [Tannerella sp.]|jgi:cytochrome c nitrite reductase small subunit|nr:cytochrome c nitrite reductase small subunit [Tannerella sp.]